MCQSIAEGGWRCATHEPGNNAMAAWAGSSMNMPLGEARAVFMDLKTEGDGVADPSQNEVVDFLSTQEFHVRHADSLTPARRRQILGQLRTALTRAWKNVLPDGATFHAWKNVTSECWSRAKRKMVATFLLGGLALTSVTGCGGTQALASQDGVPAPAVTTMSAPVTPGPTAAAHQRSPLAADDYRFTTTTAVGPDITLAQVGDVNDAYRAAVLFTLNEGLNGPNLTKTGKITEADLARAKAAMTPSAFKDLKAYATKANAGDGAALNEVFVFMSTDMVAGTDFSYRNNGDPVVSRTSFGSAPGTVMDGNDIWLDFKVEADYRLLNGKKQPITAHVKRAVSYSMERSSHGWLISGWTVKQTGATITNG